MTDALVIGGGLAGSAVAIHLAEAGRSVTLLEKEIASHDKVCGEFLSFEAGRYLAGLGVDLPRLGAVPIGAVRFAGNGRVVETALPFPAWSLSRRVLDEALLARAAATGATILRGQRVEALESDGDGWRGRAGGNFVTARSVFLASGKHELRGWKRPSGRQNDLVAYKRHWRLSALQARTLSGHVELFVFPGGYGGLEPVEDGKANLCFLIRRDRFERHGGTWDGVLEHVIGSSPILATRLKGAAALWDKPLAITAIPYGYVRCDSPEGVWRLGDQAAVIPSFSGDGMSIALHSAHLAGDIYLGGGTADFYQRRLARDVERQVALATTISRALVSPGGQALCGLAASLMPWAIGAAAKATRIPETALKAG